jgi:hypothetical protein
MYLFASIFHLTVQQAMFRRTSQHPCYCTVQYLYTIIHNTPITNHNFIPCNGVPYEGCPGAQSHALQGATTPNGS